MRRLKQNLGIFFYIKVLGLLAMFIVAVYAMYFLNTRGLQATSFGSLFTDEQEKWNVCSKELISFSYNTSAESWKLLKAQNHWRLLFNGSTKQLSPEEMDACLQKICSLKVRKIEQKDLVDFQESLNYQFADMTSLILRLNSKTSSIFWNGTLYYADDLLEFLANVPKHSCK